MLSRAPHERHGSRLAPAKSRRKGQKLAINVRGKSRISSIEPLRAEFAFALTMVVVAFAGVNAAPCANSFDGSWNVVLITQSGGCERSGQVAGQIINGALVYSAGGVSVSGRVNSEGKLNGKATMGPYYLIGSGRLVSNSGSGTWHAVSPAGPCSGVWNANRQ